ncbi:MAG: DUF1456 family protein [Mariprofundales bacterium]|nr:DUF1456 family protein [Mariprofundales bacterium]
MTNNSILKKITIANNLKHFEIKEIFKLGGSDVSSSKIKSWMAGSQNKNHEKLTDEQLEDFLNGFIIYSRGPVDEPTLLPRTIESFVIGLIESDNRDALQELYSLISDTVTND